MSIKMKAFIQTVVIFLSVVAGSVLISYGIKAMDQETAAYLGGAVIFGFLFYSMYGLVLSRIESQETLRKLSDRY